MENILLGINVFILIIIFGMFISLMIMLITLIIRESYHLIKFDKQPFECGIESILLTRTRFSLQFFSIAIIFIVFDLEIIFIIGLIPIVKFWGVVSFQLFIIFIVLTLLCEWKLNKLIWVKCYTSISNIIILIC